MQIGRYELLTDVSEITYENIIPILQEVFPLHLSNANRINYLLEFEAGNQPLMAKPGVPRVKQNRKEIDIQCVDNVAHEIAKFHVGYKWGIPITIVQRGEKDSGKDKKNEIEAISLLNEQYELQEIRKKTQRLARFVEIVGVGYTFVDINVDDEDEESYFNIETLDPRSTFVVRSSYYHNKRVMIAGTYRTDNKGNHHFTCFTKKFRFEIINLVKITNGNKVEDKEKWYHDSRSGEKNPLHIIPIIEWIRNDDRMGCFERQIEDMNCLNIIESDICNASESQINNIWHCNDVDFPTEVIEFPDGTKKEIIRKPQNNEWLQTYTSPDGKTPFVTPLVADFNYEGNLNYAITKRAYILQNADIPSRGGSSGGNTGSALNISSGWETTEAVASAQQNIMESCKMEEIKVVLRAIKECPFIEADNPLLDLKVKDCQPNIKRNKTYELATKSNAWATLVSHGCNGYHAFKMVNLTEDINQTWADSRESVEMYQMSIYGQQETNNTAVGGEGENKPNSDRIQQDSSDQTTQSPIIDGMTTK